MFSKFVSLLKATFRTFVEGVKSLVGLLEDPQSEENIVVTSKAAAVVAASAAFLCLVLPNPALKVWSDSLFRIAQQLWGSERTVHALHAG